MSKYSFSRASAILFGLSLFAITASPVFAQKLPITRPAATKSGAVVEAKKENVTGKIAAVKERIASKAASLKIKLQTFRDQKKAQVAERVNINLNNINQKQTEQMQKHLDAMLKILGRLETRVNQATPDIKDPAVAKAAIDAARATIATVSAAVSDQAQKDYTIQVSSEARIGVDAKTQRDKLHADLLALKKSVIDAKQSVANAIRVAKSGRIEVPKEGTVSGQQ